MTQHAAPSTQHSATATGRPVVQQCQLDRIKQYAARMSWTADQLDRWIAQASDGKCCRLADLRTAAQAEYVIDRIEFHYETKTQDYLARQKAARK